MNKMKKLAIILSVATITFAACTNSSDNASTTTAQEASAATGKEYAADTTTSVLTWRATHKGGFAPRYGTIKVSDGNIAVDNGSITGGSFIVNMNSLWVDTTSVTEKNKKASDLQNHLKSPDF